MKTNDIKKYLSPVLQNASEEEISLIGIAALGSNLDYIRNEQPKIFKAFKRVFKIEESKQFDRKMLHYIVTQVEPAKRSINIAGANFQMNKQPELKDIVEKANKLKQ